MPGITEGEGRSPVLKKGFTLFELMLVLALMAVTTGLIWPSFRSLHSGFVLESAAEKLRGFFFHAKSRSVLEGRRYRLSMTVDSAGYRLYRLSLIHI